MQMKIKIIYVILVFYLAISKLFVILNSFLLHLNDGSMHILRMFCGTSSLKKNHSRMGSII